MRKFILVHEKSYRNTIGEGNGHLIPVKKISRVEGYGSMLGSEIYFKEGFEIDRNNFISVEEDIEEIYEQLGYKKKKDKQEKTDKPAKTE